MKKIMHRSKVGITVGTILMTIASVSPAFAANTVVDAIPSTNTFDNSDENKGYGDHLTLVNSDNNTFGVAGKPSNYNDLTNSSNNTIRSVGIETGTADDKNVLSNSDLNTIDGRKNSLTNSDSNTIFGDGNQVNDSKSNTITGNSNLKILRSNSNTITGDSNELTDSNSNTITGNSNVLVNSHSSTITGNSVHIINGNFVAVVGDGATASGDNTTALGSNTVVSAPNSVALGANSIADRSDTVSVGSSGSERQITNVANGTAAHDAVNVGQWMAGNSIIEGKIYRTGALAAALTGIMPLPYDANSRTQIGVGMGDYHGKSAVAFGVNHYINESLLVNVGMSANGSERMWRGGLTWRLGQITKKVEPVMNNFEVDNLKYQLQQQQSELQQQQNELQQLKQQVAALTSLAGKTSVMGQ